jgi:hypothetical protein
MPLSKHQKRNLLSFKLHCNPARSKGLYQATPSGVLQVMK